MTVLQELLTDESAEQMLNDLEQVQKADNPDTESWEIALQFNEENIPMMKEKLQEKLEQDSQVEADDG